MSSTLPISPSQLLSQIVDAVELLGATAESQLRYLDSIGLEDGIDELALQFDDVIPAISQLSEAEFINAEATHVLHQLNDELTAMSGPDNENLWTAWALRTAPRWQTIRRLAQRALFALNRTGRPSIESA